jgi:hypothetical protein
MAVVKLLGQSSCSSGASGKIDESFYQSILDEKFMLCGVVQGGDPGPSAFVRITSRLVP